MDRTNFARYDLHRLDALPTLEQVAKRKADRHARSALTATAWDTSKRARKRNRAIGVALNYFYLKHLRQVALEAIDDRDPGWRLIGDVPAPTRDRCARAALRDTAKLLAA